MLEIDQLKLGYNGNIVVDLPKLTLKRGEDCLISGASGCGKTTLLYAIAGLIPATSGNIAIEGTDITRLSESARDHFRGRNIGIIFQTLHLVKSLSVMDNILLASTLAGIPADAKRATEVLAQLGIADKKNARPSELSQGQAQRVAIARAILHKPGLILADEPTSSLDDASCDAVLSLIKQAARDTNAALLISTHDSRVKSHFSKVVSL